MAFHHSPKIVTNGLVLCLDAANRKSYSGTGTAWTDLAGTNNGTLTNGPTFNSANGGSIVFDGATNYVTMNTVYNPDTTGNITLDIWVYFTGPFSTYLTEPPTTNLAGVFGQGYFGGFNGYGIGFGVATGNIYSVNFQTRVGGNVINCGTTSVSLNSWFHIVGVLDRSITNLSYIYFNGQLVNSVSCSSLIGQNLNPNATEFRIGANTFPFFCGCRIARGSVYNRNLSPAEVLQNYNATKGRFKL